MEYYVGFEGLRLALLFYLSLPEEKTFALRLRQTVLRMIPAAVGVVIFMLWRMLLFSGTRGTTDLGQMVHAWRAAPLTQTAGLVANMVQDVLSVTVFAWGVPFYSLLQPLSIDHVLVALGAAVLAGGLTWVAISRLSLVGIDPHEENSQGQTAPAGLDMLWIGLFAVVITLIPINFGDRSVLFTSFSRFTLPGSVGACLAVTGALMALTRARLAAWAPIVLVALAAATHIANSYAYANSWSLVRNFWWQVAWRAPDIQPNTVIVAGYSNQGIGEDYFVWAPASMIYYPKISDVGQPVVKLSAVTLDKSDIQLILAGGSRTRVHRGTLIPLDYSQALVLSLPAPGACVHAIDGNQPELSTADRMEITVSAPRSNIDLIQADASPHTPPAVVFGAEPAHNWCYYYEKASLARQQKNWSEVVRLGDEAAKAGLSPNDPVEWMPFIEAYANAGRGPKVDQITKALTSSPYLQYQACQIFQHKTGAGPDLPDAVIRRLNQAVCGGPG
jgi:hypothetical protein